MVTPVTSLGSRSGVNWIRLCVPCMELAIALASEVFPVPGKSSSSRCPSETRQVSARRTMCCLAEHGLLDVRYQRAEGPREPVGLLGRHLRRARGCCGHDSSDSFVLCRVYCLRGTVPSDSVMVIGHRLAVRSVLALRVTRTRRRCCSPSRCAPFQCAVVRTWKNTPLLSAAGGGQGGARGEVSDRDVRSCSSHRAGRSCRRRPARRCPSRRRRSGWAGCGSVVADALTVPDAGAR